MRDLIRKAVGADCMLEAAAVQDYAVHGVPPRVVVAPRDADQAVAIMKLACEEALSVECAGAGTRLRGGNAPRKLDIVMTSKRMHAIAEYEPSDLVISVGAGTTFADLDLAVARYNQFLALEPSGTRKSTIGASVATGAAGPLRYAHGTPRDQVLGLEVVTGDGRQLSFGGRVVKNVAGYDIVRLMVGSRGTLGFLTRVNLRLKPQPEVDRTVVVQAPSFDVIADVSDAIISQGLDPVALEILSDELSQHIVHEKGWTLLVRLHGNAAGITDARARVFQVADGLIVRDVDAAVWHELAEHEAAAGAKLRFANLPSAFRDTTAIALRSGQSAAMTNARVAVHAGDGIVRLLGDGVAAGAADAIAHERADMAKSGGTLIIERMPNDFEMEAFGHADPAGLMQAMKKVFDPAGILGPGRFVL